MCVFFSKCFGLAGTLFAEVWALARRPLTRIELGNPFFDTMCLFFRRQPSQIFGKVWLLNSFFFTAGKTARFANMFLFARQFFFTKRPRITNNRHDHRTSANFGGR